jgi:rRNA processing protein Gar1
MICKSHLQARALLGETVYSEQGTMVGTVVDVFGPVEKPYLKVLKKNGENVHTLYVK